MLILTSIRSEIATDEDLKDTSFENDEQSDNDEPNEIELKTENVTASGYSSVDNAELGHNNIEIDTKSNNIFDEDDVNNVTRSGPPALPTSNTEYLQDINNSLSFQVPVENHIHLI